MNVLLAIDESPFADAVLNFVFRHNWDNRVSFSVLYVVEPLLVGSYMSILPSALLAEINDKAKVEGAALVKTIAQKLRQSYPAVSVKEQVVEGFPKEEIIEFATSWPADFIVVGSHGRRGIKRLLLGSVSQAVCSAAPCSVLVVRPQSQHLKAEADQQEVADSVELQP
jgi:nucleotide-binding universal stress UspA family protein